MKLNKLALLTSVFVIAGASSAYAYWVHYGNDGVAGAFCSGLKNSAAYKKAEMEPYAFLIEGKNGWIFRTENDFRKDWDVNDKTANYLLSLQNAFKQHNAHLLIVMPPVRGMIHFDQLSGGQRKKFGLQDAGPVWDNYENAIKSLQVRGINIIGINRGETAPDFYYKRDHHWTSSGARITAQKIAATVKKTGLYAQIPHETFKSQNRNPVPHKSSFEKAFHQICNTDLQSEVTAHYDTVQQTSAAGSADLFAEPVPPQVILLGTSNSLSDSSDANFDGFLKEALSADISNLSYAGAGIDTSIMSFLNSPQFSDNVPKIVIWEVPGYYDFNVMDDKLFNQIVPASFGACPAYAVKQQSFTINPDYSQTVLFHASEQPEQNLQPIAYPADMPEWKNLYIHLAFAKPMADKFSLKFQYESGTKRQDFERSEQYPDDGNFYTLFPDSTETLQRITLVTPDTAVEPIDMNMQICPLPDIGKPL